MALGGLYRPRLGAVAAKRAPADGLTWLRRVLALAVVVLVIEVLYLPFHSPRFAVTGVEVRGEAGVAAEVASAIHLPANTNFFLAPTRKLVAQAKRLPSVREATLQRDWGLSPGPHGGAARGDGRDSRGEAGGAD